LIGRLLFTYIFSVTWILSTQRRLRDAAVRARRQQQLRIVELAERFRLKEEVLHALDALRERPAGWRIRYGLRLLYMDHFAVFLLASVLALLLCVVPMTWAVRDTALVFLIASAAVTSFFLSRARDVSPVQKLRRAAQRIEKLIRVRYVVFGHSHVPANETLEGGGTYFNTGSWSDAHSGLMHVCVLRGTEATAELRRWCTTTETPVPVAGGR
jgi:hypothetical protein